MAKNIDFMGAIFPDVPSVKLPQQGGGLVSFDDTTDATATADKILQGYTAYANGEKLVGTASGGITPSGTISITQNGTVDVTQYASADVNVSGGEVRFASASLTRDSSTQLSSRLKGNPKMLVIYCDGNFQAVSSSTSIYLETLIDVPNFASLKYVRCYNRKTGACGSLSSIAPNATISWTFANNIITVTTNGLYFPSESVGYYKVMYAY